MTTTTTQTCRCGAIPGARGGHDMFGDWHPETAIDHLRQVPASAVVYLQAFGDTYPAIRVVALDARGRCQACAAKQGGWA